MSKKILVIVLAILAGIVVSFGIVLAGNVLAPTSEVSSVESEETPVSESIERDPANTGDYLDYTPALFEETEGRKVLFFHASWCPVCRALENDILSRGVPADLTIFKVDYDEATDLVQKYEVRLQSTVVYVDDDGNLLSSAILFDNANLASLVDAAP
jgi:thiol-disulfide isomerase/thioredoxin